jgi:hypothetical protein
MTIEEIMAKAAAHMEALAAESTSNAIDMLYDTGFPEPEEIEAFTKWYSELLRLDKIENLKQLRAWLERGGEPLQ